MLGAPRTSLFVVFRDPVHSAAAARALLSFAWAALVRGKVLGLGLGSPTCRSFVLYA